MIKDTLELIQKLAAIKETTADLKTRVIGIESSIASISERLLKLEVRQEEMRTSLKSQIMAEIVGDMTRAQVEWEFRWRDLEQRTKTQSRRPLFRSEVDPNGDDETDDLDV